MVRHPMVPAGMGPGVAGPSDHGEGIASDCPGMHRVGSTVGFPVRHCDNQVVVASLRSRTSRHPHCLHMLRALAFVEARHSFHLRPQYINTKVNHLADDLSRNNLPSFLTMVPRAAREPVPLPVPLLSLLLDPEVDWISPRWRRLFNDIFRTASPSRHCEPTIRR